MPDTPRKTPDSPAVRSPDSKPDDGNAAAQQDPARPPEVGGPKGPEPTRYGDWEKAGRCIDF